MSNSKLTWLLGQPSGSSDSKTSSSAFQSPSTSCGGGVFYRHPHKPSCFLRHTGPSPLLFIRDHRERASPRCRTPGSLLILAQRN